MVSSRSEEIDSLKKAYPAARSWGLWHTICTIPLNTVFKSSKCTIEITIPRSYPREKVTIKLLNPVKHSWMALDKTIRIPEYLHRRSLVEIVNAVITNFGEANKPASMPITHDEGVSAKGKRLEKEEPKEAIDHLRKRELESIVMNCARNPPKEALQDILKLTEEEVICMSADTDEIRKVLCSTREIAPLVAHLKEILAINETLITTMMSNMGKKEQMLQRIRNYCGKIESSDVLANAKRSIREYAKRFDERISVDISKLELEISAKEERIESGEESFEDREVRESFAELRRKLNKLAAIQISLNSTQRLRI